MSETQNICVDIFSQMSNLLSNFSANMVGAEGFTNDSGFMQETMPTEATGSNFEASINNYASMALIGVMALFLVFAQYNT